MLMTSAGNGFDRSRRGGRLLPALALALASVIAAPATAQMFTDHPPPVPPGLVEKNGSNSLPSAPRGIPSPVSSTRTCW